MVYFKLVTTNVTFLKPTQTKKSGKCWCKYKLARFQVFVDSEVKRILTDIYMDDGLMSLFFFTVNFFFLNFIKNTRLHFTSKRNIHRTEKKL